MVEKKEVIKEEEVSKVKAYNIKLKNIKKIDEVANTEENGNKSKAINKMIEVYK